MNQVNATNPMFGIFLFMLGGLSGAVFYLPFSKVKKWGMGELLADLRAGGPCAGAVDSGLHHRSEHACGAARRAAARDCLLPDLRQCCGDSAV